MRVCIVGASHFTNDDRMFYREAVTLSAQHVVEVVGAGEAEQRQIRDGIPVTSYRKRSKAAHIFLLVQIFMHLRAIESDVIHCFDLETMVTAVVLSRLVSKRPLIVYDAHENFPSLMAGYPYWIFVLPSALAIALEFFLGVVERFFSSFCAAFVTDRDYLTSRFSVYGKPAISVRNVASLSWYDNASGTRALEDVKDPIIIYFGTLNVRKGLDTAIQAKILLEKQGIRSCLVLAGDLRDAGRYVDPSSVPGVRVWGWLDYKDDLPGFLKKASLGLVLIKPVIKSYVTSPPSKLFHCMVASLPVIAGDTPGIRPIVMKENCGILIDAASPEQVSKAIEELLKDEKMRKLMGENARRAAEREYNWEMESQKLLTLYRSLESWSSICQRNSLQL